MAKLKAVDFVNETFIAFKQDKPIDCDNQMANNIKRQRYFLSEQLFAFVRLYVNKIGFDIYR